MYTLYTNNHLCIPLFGLGHWMFVFIGLHDHAKMSCFRGFPLFIVVNLICLRINPGHK